MNSFDRSIYFPLKNKFLLSDMSDFLKENCLKFQFKDNFEIIDVSSLEQIRDKSLLFVDDTNFDLDKINLQNICLITSLSEIFDKFENNIFLVKNINIAYQDIVNHLFYHDDSSNLPDKYLKVGNSLISIHSKIHDSVQIGANCTISRGVEIKKNSIIKNNVVIKNSLIEKNVVISDGCCIGTTGFGFDYNYRGSKHLSPQIGIVHINENTHIGSNCSIDRAKIDKTYIGKNSMIDNLVHIAHNVYIDDFACIAGQTGISGSCKIGKFCTIGGQSGLAGHISIGNNVVIAAKSGVTKNIADNLTVAGFPAIDINKWKKNIIKNRKTSIKTNV